MMKSFVAILWSTLITVAVSQDDFPDIREKYDLKPSLSRLLVRSITPENTVEVDGKVYDLSKLKPYNVFTQKARYMVNNEYQSELPPTRLYTTKTSDGEVILLRVGEDGRTTEHVKIYSKEGLVTELVQTSAGKNEFVIVSDDMIDYDAINARSTFGCTGHDEFLAGDNEHGRLLHEDHHHDHLDQIDANNPSTPRGLQAECTEYKVIELAVAFESSFCATYSSPEAASTKATEIVAGVSIKYEQTAFNLCTKVSLSHLEAQCDSTTDPYKQYVTQNQSGCGGNGLLQGFQGYWNSNRGDIHRDSAQLFSGTGLECSGGSCVIGCAYVGVLCSDRGYGVNYATFSGNANSVEVLVAHELGHNADASHYVDGGATYIMYPSVNAAPNGFSDVSVTSFLDHFETVDCIDVTTSSCGDGVCDFPSETSETCPLDCVGVSPKAWCGNGICESGDGEDCNNCEADCKRLSSREVGKQCCGDSDVRCDDPLCHRHRFCLNRRKGSETWTCGDGVCSRGETAAACPNDCSTETCCGNGICESGEDCLSCSEDCAGDTSSESKRRYCCGEMKTGCDNPECTTGEFQCNMNMVSSCSARVAL